LYNVAHLEVKNLNNCMITNTASLLRCNFWRENTTRKNDQRCSPHRGLFDNVKYIVYII